MASEDVGVQEARRVCRLMGDNHMHGERTEG